MRAVLESTITSFFFSNFPSNWSVDVMWKHFERFSAVVDVFIPQKKTSLGKDFGFVRFKGVQDTAQLEKDMRGVLIGPNKLTMLNPGGVSRDRQETGPSRTKGVPCISKLENPRVIKIDGLLQLLGCILMGKKVKSVEVSKVESIKLECLKHCVVGEVKDTELLNEINHLLRDGGFHNCVAKYIGSHQVLLECPSEENPKKMLEEG